MSKMKLVLFCCSFFVCTFLNAQIEIAHLTSKDFSATGFGGFLNFAIPVTEGNSVTAEAGVYSFKQDDNQIVLIPLLLGYRYTFNGSGSGIYIEPTAGYTIGASDQQKLDANGSAIIVDGKYAEQKAARVTTGIGAGYIFPGRIAFNLGLRYQHVFVSGDPSLNMVSFRISHSFSFRRREE